MTLGGKTGKSGCDTVNVAIYPQEHTPNSVDQLRVDRSAVSFAPNSYLPDATAEGEGGPLAEERLVGGKPGAFAPERDQQLALRWGSPPPPPALRIASDPRRAVPLPQSLPR